MWVNIDLKAPDEGEWVALTVVTADGEATPIGYLDREMFLNLREPFLQIEAIIRNYLER